MKQSYQALFVLTFAYVAVFSLSSLTSNMWLGLIFELAAVLVALVLERKALLCKMTPSNAGIGFSPRPILPALCLLPLFLCVVIGLSVASEALAALVGYNGAYEYGDSYLLCLFTSALIPAVTEELFCRYIFLRRLTPYSRMGAVLASALFFAFLHGNLVQMPYAFLAGVMLGALAVVTGSVLPGMVFHFANNALSITLHFYGGGTFGALLPYLLGGTCAAGLVCLYLLRARLMPAARRLRGEGEVTPATLLGKLFASPLLIFLLIFAAEAVLRGAS